MDNAIEIKGKTVEEALAQAAKELNTTKENVNYTIIEESNKTLFSILAPKYVIIKASVIDESKCEKVQPKEEKSVDENKKEFVVEDLTEVQKQDVENSIKEFLNNYFAVMKLDYKYEFKILSNIVEINIFGENAGLLIGYRGEILDSLQTILSIIASKKAERNVKVQLDIENYREKRKVILVDLANKIANSVIRTGRNITLEPMVAYERKVIHSTLQSNNKVETISIGDEPYRKVVVKLKK